MNGDRILNHMFGFHKPRKRMLESDSNKKTDPGRYFS
jgi:hypothetical protein